LMSLFDSQRIDMVVTLQALTAVPFLPLVEEHKVPLLASLTSIKSEEFSAKSEYAFLMYPLPTDQISRIVEYAKQNNFSRIALFTINDEFGVTMSQLFAEMFQGEIVANEHFEIQETDFRTGLIKIKEAKPELILFLGYPPHAINFVTQRKELAMSGIPVVSTEDIQSNYVRAMAKGLLGNVVSLVPEATVSERAQDFRDAFFEAYNEEPDFLAFLGYDTMLVLDDVQKKGTPALEALSAVDVDGLNGRIRFNQHGEIELPLVFVNAEDRTIVS
jgi:branched-chain amino acid transport system substrate-binding protein